MESFSFYDYKYNKKITAERRNGMVHVHVLTHGIVVELCMPVVTLKSRIAASSLFGLKKRRVIEVDDCVDSRLLYNFIPLEHVTTRELPRTISGEPWRVDARRIRYN